MSENGPDQNGPDQNGPDNAPDQDLVEIADSGRSAVQEITGATLDWRTAVLTPLLAVVSALIIGALIIAFADVDRFGLWFSNPGEAITESAQVIGEAYYALLEGAFFGARPISETLTRATPLILAGLAVAAGFQAGLFNIGANGQILMGGMVTLWIGFAFDLPAIIHVPLAMFGGLLGGALFGAIPGLLRARTGAHEVITTIMLNFVALRLVDYWLTRPFFQLEGRSDPISKNVLESARYPKILAPLLDDPRLRLHIGIIIAIIAAAALWWVLNRSTLGFEFRAVGANADAAKYGGMNVVWLYVSIMALSGAFAGLAGADQVAGTLGRASPGFAGVIGFDAIALALLGRSHPVGVVLSGLLFGALIAGGQRMQVVTDIGIDIVTVIQALIIVFIAAPALIRAIYRVRTGDEAARVTQGWST